MVNFRDGKARMYKSIMDIRMRVLLAHRIIPETRILYDDNKYFMIVQYACKSVTYLLKSYERFRTDLIVWKSEALVYVYMRRLAVLYAVKASD